MLPPTMPMSQPAVYSQYVSPTPIPPPTMPMSQPAPYSQYVLPTPIPSNLVNTDSRPYVSQQSIQAPQLFAARQPLAAPFEIPSTEYEPHNPHRLSPDEFDAYKSKLNTLQGVEYSDPIPQKRPGNLTAEEKELLNTEADQFEQRLRYLETLAGSTRHGQDEAGPQMRQNPMTMLDPMMRKFDDKFLPMPLGAGWDCTRFTFYKGFYIERDKIARREAQLKALGEYHQNDWTYWFAGIEKDEDVLDDEYWDRDMSKFVEQARKEMILYGSPELQRPPQSPIPYEHQFNIIEQMNSNAGRLPGGRVNPNYKAYDRMRMMQTRTAMMTDPMLDYQLDSLVNT
jgi:hypothetical protein